MSQRFSYPLSGADRFQLYFDEIARKNTGIGNVIRAAITLEGIIPEEIIRQNIGENEWVRFLSGLILKKNNFSALFRFENGGNHHQSIITFHQVTFREVMNLAALKDCDLHAGHSMHVDVAYGDSKTHLIFSVSHVLMDHAGMEILLSSLTGENNVVASQNFRYQKSFSNKLSGAFSATLFISSLSSWSMKRLAGKSGPASASFGLIELTKKESDRVKIHMIKDLKANSLSFFLGCSLFALGKLPELSIGKNIFVPVPIDRRPLSSRNSLLSNFISFLYFKAKDSDLVSLEKITDVISKQTISQAKKNIPEKFTSLLDIFRFVPGFLYKTFIGLPSNGHAATFAFSLLSNSSLEGKNIFGSSVLDVTHFPPLITPPGLNIIFSEFDGRLKILCSFDQSRITKEDVDSYLETLKLNLLG